jgi:hypothetical protein
MMQRYFGAFVRGMIGNIHQNVITILDSGAIVYNAVRMDMTRTRSQHTLEIRKGNPAECVDQTDNGTGGDRGDIDEIWNHPRVVEWDTITSAGKSYHRSDSKFS